MTPTIAATVRRAFTIRQPHWAGRVHFHLGGNGLPQVCDRQRCDSPGLTTEDLAGPRR